MAKRNPESQTLEIRLKIEKAMTKEGWSTALCRKLEKRLGISKSSIYRHRAVILREWAEHHQIEDKDATRADMLNRLHRWQEAAFKAGKFGGLASLTRLEIMITGIEAPTRLEVISRQDEGEQKARGLWRRRSLEQSDDVIDVEAEVVEGEGQAVALIESG